MPLALVGGLLAEVEPGPAPSPTARVLEDWEVTPGLAGFLATFGVAVAAVLLFLSLSRHMRKANAYARAHGIEVPERRGIGVRRDASVSGSPADAAPEAVASPSDGSDGRAGPRDAPPNGGDDQRPGGTS